ncbi:MULTISPECIES: DEAD/DEAH box helicase [Streptomyces]|nr:MULTISPECIES: DEAD/DEAH box helicase [Streptomyces]MBZ6128765.1 Helicase associated domain protein [Streptomyces olivaceus]MBZ6162874.1 Helicase associated domain protein [Streptomyces olivaceus]MBZ6190677.1 Helicase associated domain protein [Streptomyces olivaceus]MBZ6225364.1 Helicase associated domain protein [Streptomyces olivaceus]MBZ6239212.1 Helicase associated domain protein [Streptomyces olivaceus]
MSHELRPYQEEAVAAIAAGLREGGRGQLHAACGSGKTLISAIAAVRLVPADGLLVVFTPSLALVAQTVQEWKAFSPADAVLAVCSDDTVTDAPAHLDDISEQTSTDVEEILGWLSGTQGRRLVVATYVSAHRLAKALRTAGTVADLAVHDEAHHLAGRADYTTRRILDGAFLPARRRLFMTATPRIDDLRVDTSSGLSMSDETVFGPVLYSYPWARAISEGYLDDYRIVITGVTERQMLDLLQDDEHQHVEAPGAPDLRTLAAQVVLAQAARQYGLRRILAFCHRLDAAQEFVRSLPSTLARMEPSRRPESTPHADRITGEHSHAQRERILATLREPPGGWTVLANVRCLSEGVDVPAVDAVLFTHPKRSQVDIVQAVGRALRRSGTGQDTATVIVPIVVPDSAEEIGDLEPGEFRILWQVLRALRAHDETLGIELDTQRANEHTVPTPELPSRITIQLPPGSTDSLLAQLTALTVRQTTSSWWTGYGHAATYRARHGHLEVPFAHVTADGFRLGQWIANARQHRRKGWLRSDRIDALDKLGMLWGTAGLPWHRFLDELRAFRREFGHALVPQSYATPDGYRLGSKINSTRSNTHRVPDFVRRALDDLGMVWDTRDLRWQQLYTACQQYAAEHGHLHVPVSYTAPDGYALGARLKRVRRAAEEGRLDPSERASLEELGMVFASSEDRAWTDFIDACDRYVTAHGSLATVEKAYVDDTGYRLGARISYYRNLNNGTKTGGIPSQRRTELEDRGMLWRVAPARDLHPDEHARLQQLTGPELGTAIVQLTDDEGVTQSSIAAALGIHRSYLNTKIKRFRDTGTWPDRRATRARAVHTS